MKELLGKGSLYTSATALQLSASLIVTPVVTRLLTPDRFGQLSLALIVVQIGGVIAAVGLPAAITRLYFEGAAGPHRAAGLVAGSAFLAVLITGVLDALGPLWIVAFDGVQYDTTFRLAVWGIPPLVAARAAQALFRARGKPASFVIVAAVLTLGAHGLGMILVALNPAVTQYLLGLLIGQSIGALVAGLLMGRGLITKRAALQEALAIGAPAVPHGLALYALSAGDRIVLERILGLSSVGRYQAAYLAGALGISILIGLNNAWAPMIHGAHPDERWDLLRSTTLVVTRVAATLTIGLAALAPIAMDLLVPDTYNPADLARVMSTVALSTVPYAIYLSAIHILFQEKRTGSLALITPLVAVGNIGLNYLLIPRWNLLGAAVASTVSYFVLAIGMHLVAVRVMRVKWPWRSIFGIGLVATVSVAVSILVPGHGGWLVARVVVAMAAGGLLIAGIRRLVLGHETPSPWMHRKRE